MWADPEALPGGVNPGIGLILTPRPFATLDETVRATIPAGETIAALLDRAIAEGLLDASVRRFVRVSIGPHLILPADWRRVRPKAGQILLVSVQPMDGGSVRSLLQLAVVAGAAFVGYAIGGPLGALAAAAISIGGNLIINALIPPVQPKAPDRNPRYSLDGASNAATPHDPVPIVLGKRRVYPPRCANFYTVLVGQDVYLRCVMQPSAGWVDREQVKIGETLIDGYDGVTLNWHTRPDDATTLSYFDTTPGETALALPLTSASGWVTRSTPILGTRIVLDVGFLSGLYRVDSGGHTRSQTATVEIRYGPPGGDPASATAAPFGSAGVVSFSMASTDPYRQSFDWTVASGMYDVHLRRTNADSTDSQVADKATWINLRAFYPAPALPQAATTPWVEIEIKASDQLNGVLDTFNFVATSMVPQVTASGLASGFIATRNPADLYTALTYPPFSTIELDDDERVFPDLAAWRDLCDTQGWLCDLVEASETSVGELLLRAAACGRARPSIDFGALTVMVDWTKPAPRQLFAARTVEKFKGALAYPEEVHGLRLRFANAAKYYADDSVTVWAPGYDASTATRYDSVELRDIVDVDLVEREGQRIMAERVARPETFTFDQDIEALVVRDGERAWLSHPVALIGQISARVAAVVARTVTGGGTQHGVRLDERVIFVFGTTYGLAYRRGSGGLVSVELAAFAGTTDTIWFVAEPSTLPQPNDLASFGERLIETLDVIVDRITPKPGLRAEIACVAYAPELQTLDTIPVTSARTALSIPPGAKGGLLIDRGDAATQEAISRLLATLNAIGSIAGDAAVTADGKVQTFYQATAPAESDPGVDLGVGDLWFDSDDGNKLYRWSGTGWVSQQDHSIGDAITAAAGAQATADGKVTTFYGETAPTAEGIGDLWYRSSTKTLSRWSGSSWVVSSAAGVSDYADLTAAHTAAAIAGQGALATQNTVDWATQIIGASKVAGNLIPDPITLSDLYFASSACALQVNSTGARLADRYRVTMDADSYFAWMANPGSRRIPVSTGQTIFYQHAVFTSTPAGSTQALYNGLDANGSYVGTYSFSGSTVAGSTSYGSWTIAKGSAVIPAGIAFIWPHAAGSGLTSRAYFGEPFVGYHQAGADITAINTAAAITGQGALATVNVADWLTQIAGAAKPANYADVTGANVAASIAGQGALATLNTVDYASQVTGKPTGGGGAITVAMGATIMHYVPNGGTVAVSAAVGASASSTGSGNIHATIMADGSVFASGPSNPYGPGEPVSGSDSAFSDTFTNSGASRVVNFTSGYVKTGGSVTIDASQSFLTA